MPLQAIKGPYIIYSQRAPYRHAESPCREEPMQTGGPIRQVAPTDKQSLQTRGSYIQAAPIDTVQFLQTRGPYMIYRQATPQTRIPYRTNAPTDAMQFLHKRGPFINNDIQARVLLAKGFIQARGHNISITALPDFKKIIHFF